VIGANQAGLTTPHSLRVSILEELGSLIGCHQRVFTTLPDGCRPDVCKMALHSGLIFLGDAKDTETPGCRATAQRLSRYSDWLASHVKSGRSGALAICHAKDRYSTGWIVLLERLTSRSGLNGSFAEVITLDTCSISTVSFFPKQRSLIRDRPEWPKSQKILRFWPIPQTKMY
jgi:hypothetical protein